MSSSSSIEEEYAQAIASNIAQELLNRLNTSKPSPSPSQQDSFKQAVDGEAEMVVVEETKEAEDSNKTTFNDEVRFHVELLKRQPYYRAYNPGIGDVATAGGGGRQSPPLV